MRYSTFFKFVAIILCAASLLTLAGSGLGIFFMVELDLYDKTVNQFITDRYQADARYYAQVVAQRYASHELGGFPEDFLENEYPGWLDQTFGGNGLGYLLTDEEGNVLEELNPDVENYAHQSFTIPVEGNYMHMIHSEPVAPEAHFGLADGEYGIIDRVGNGANPVYSIRISHDGGSEGVSTDDSANPLGWLERGVDGTIYFNQATDFSFHHPSGAEITHITFMDDNDQVLYEVADSNPVAIVTQDPSGSHFIHLFHETDNSMGDPAWRPVYKAIFYGEDSETPIEILGSSQPIGAAALGENGHLNFTLYVESANLKNAVSICSMVLMDADGSILFAQADPQLQTSGTQVATSDGINFSSHPDAIAMAMPKEPAPETAPVDAIPEAVSGEAAADTAAAEAAPEAAPAEPAEGAAEAAAQEVSAEPEPAPEETAVTVEAMPEAVPLEETVSVTVPETLPLAPEDQLPPETAAPTEPDYRDMEINGKSVREYSIETYTYYDPQTQQPMDAKTIFLPMPAYTVEIFFRPDLDENAYAYTLLGLLKQFSSLLLPVLLGSLLILALTVVYLCAAAAHSRRSPEIRAGGLNRVPLDLYFVIDACLVIGLGALLVVFCSDVLPKNMQVGLVLIPLLAYLISLIFVGFCFALVAQGKTPGGYWWRNSLCGRLLTGGVGSLEKGTDWTVKRFFPWLWKLACGLWDLVLLILQKLWTLIAKVFGWLAGMFRRIVAVLPLTWQWMLGGAVLLLLGLLVWANRRDGWGILWLLVGFALVLYISQCFGILLGAAKRMNKGDLETKINDKRMIGCFREFAENLNSLADVVVAAAQKQLRSERMKTELITNVSHDIKTPLTSIINYVDLLQKPHSEEEGAQYLEVLDRQSQRLKKLIDDLMDMSKANTGNMNVELTRLDAVESVNQALGEFADKLEKADLMPVFRHNTGEAFIMADGKLVWRVLSNLLGNAVKYAMPGTRLYLDLMNLDGRVILSLKNISRDELNINAEELMERFVRGDDSRNTEGSGLGLNIAKSLMELQKGHLQLLVDGDLFKVTLVFPSAE